MHPFLHAHLPHFHSGPPVVLHYFGGRGLAQSIRLLLAELHIPYEERSFASKEEWLAFKATSPYGQAPVLDIDGLKLCQTRAICKYLARKGGLYGRNIQEDYAIDAIVEAAADFQKSIPSSSFRAIAAGTLENPTEEEAAAYSAFVESAKTNFIARWERHLATRPTPHFVGHHFTLADVVIYDLLSGVTKWPMYASLLDEAPALRAFLAHTSHRSAIAHFEASPRNHPWPPSQEYVKRIISWLYQ